MKLPDTYYNIRYGVPNLFKWFKVIWKDRSWDNYHIYVMLQHKLKLMAKDFKRYDIHLSADDKVKQIQLCVNLLNRLMEDNYASEEWDAAIGNYDNWIKNLNNKIPEQRKLVKIAIEKQNYMYTQDMNMLFEMLRKYIDGWWY